MVDTHDLEISSDEDMEDDLAGGQKVDEPFDINGDGTVIKTIVREGKGWKKPPKGADVFVHYVGTLEDGTVFDSSRDRAQEFNFKLGRGVIAGWSEGVKTMKKGELSRFVIKPEKAYGESGSPPKIPPNATLTFEIELINWHDEDDITKDGGIIKKTLIESPDYSRPANLSKVALHMRIMLTSNNTVVLDSESNQSPLEFVLDEMVYPDGIETAIKSMKNGEEAEFTIQPSYAFGSLGHSELNIPPNASIKLWVKLISFENEKESYTLSPEEKLSNCDSKKLMGNEWFKKKQYARAVRRYEMALSYISNDYAFSDDIKKDAKEKKLPIHLNLAACYLQSENWPKAAENAKKALEIDAHSIKGLFRLATAQRHLLDWDAAQKNLLTALELSPTDKAIRAELAKLKQLKKQQNEKDKQRFSGWLNKLNAKPEKAFAENKEQRANASEIANDEDLAGGETEGRNDDKVVDDADTFMADSEQIHNGAP